MKPFLAGAFLLLATTCVATSKPASEALKDYSTFNDEGRAFLDKLDIKAGVVNIGHGVTINVADGFYFLDAKDSEKVLVEDWGNPPSAGTLGMIFPASAAPISEENWGIELSFDTLGYVNDEDAASIDYAALLTEMQGDTEAGNEERVKAGYDPVQLIGWATPPKYDSANKRLHWAKELKFGTSETNTLNYKVRVLGREGVFIMNYIADMKSLPDISGSVDKVMAMVAFQEGKRYADFQPGVDTVAAVGIGGLIAGKVLAKTGLIAVALVFLKKFGFLLLLPVVWLFRKLRGASQ